MALRQSGLKQLINEYIGMMENEKNFITVGFYFVCRYVCKNGRNQSPFDKEARIQFWKYKEMGYF